MALSRHSRLAHASRVLLYAIGLNEATKFAHTCFLSADFCVTLVGAGMVWVMRVDNWMILWLPRFFCSALAFFFSPDAWRLLEAAPETISGTVLGIEDISGTCVGRGEVVVTLAGGCGLSFSCSQDKGRSSALMNGSASSASGVGVLGSACITELLAISSPPTGLAAVSALALEAVKRSGSVL